MILVTRTHTGTVPKTMSPLIGSQYSLATVFQVVASKEFHANDGEEIVEENQHNGHTERSKVKGQRSVTSHLVLTTSYPNDSGLMFYRVESC